MGMAWRMGEETFQSCCGTRAEKVMKEMVQTTKETPRIRGIPVIPEADYRMLKMAWNCIAYDALSVCVPNKWRGEI